MHLMEHRNHSEVPFNRVPPAQGLQEKTDYYLQFIRNISTRPRDDIGSSSSTPRRDKHDLETME